MVFPSITVCNLNQVEASFIREPIDFENVSLSRMTKTDLLMKEFMFGHQDNLTQEEEKYLERVKNWRNFRAFTFLGGFQLLDLIIMELKSHMTCRKFKVTHCVGGNFICQKKSFTRFALQSECCNFNQ